MPQHPTDADIELVNREILARRAGAKLPAEGQQPGVDARAAADLSGLTANHFRAGIRPLTDPEVTEWVAAYRAQYQRYADSEIVTLMESRLAAALAADGRTLPPFAPAERLRILRLAAAKAGNGI
jgi:hypothetical protein